MLTLPCPIFVQNNFLEKLFTATFSYFIKLKKMRVKWMNEKDGFTLLLCISNITNCHIKPIHLICLCLEIERVTKNIVS